MISANADELWCSCLRSSFYSHLVVRRSHPFVRLYRPSAYALMYTKKRKKNEETDSIFNKEDKDTNKQTKSKGKKQWMIFERQELCFFVLTMFSRHRISNSYKTNKEKSKQKTHTRTRTHIQSLQLFKSKLNKHTHR